MMRRPITPDAVLGRAFSTFVPLRDGSAIRIRAIRPDDKQRLLGHFSRLSEQSVYQRFFGVKKSLTPEDLVLFTELDFVDAVGLVATLGEAEQERIVGVGRYFVDPAGPRAAARRGGVRRGGCATGARHRHASARAADPLRAPRRDRQLRGGQRPHAARVLATWGSRSRAVNTA